MKRRLVEMVFGSSKRLGERAEWFAKRPAPLPEGLQAFFEQLNALRSHLDKIYQGRFPEFSSDYAYVFVNDLVPSLLKKDVLQDLKRGEKVHAHQFDGIFKWIDVWNKPETRDAMKSWVESHKGEATEQWAREYAKGVHRLLSELPRSIDWAEMVKEK